MHTSSLAAPPSRSKASLARFTAMGMCVETDFEFTLLPAAGESSAPDLTLVEGAYFPPALAKVRHFGHPGDAPGYISGFEDENGMQIRIGGAGRYWLRPGYRHMTYELEPDRPIADAQHWFTAFVLGVVAQCQRRIVLHASSVQIANVGVAFIGVGGTGKTTLAAAFARDGFPLLSEDSLPVRLADGALVAHPYVPGLRLWPESVAALAGADPGYDVALSWLEKKRLPMGSDWGQVASHEINLPVIYDLAPATDDSDGIAIDEVSGAQKVVRLVGSTYFAEVLSTRQQFDLMSRLETVAEAVRMRRITYPRRFDSLPALKETIIRDSREVAGGCA